jgi:hypothetical protein
MKKLTLLPFLILISYTAYAQKPAPKMQVLSLECGVSGRQIANGFQYYDFNKDIKTSLSILIGNGLISVRDTESIFAMDVPVTITSSEYSGQTQFRTEGNKADIKISVSINRNSGTIRATRVGIGDGTSVSINTSGTCEKVSDKQKF